MTQRKGWSQLGLAALGEDPTVWTAADAARVLGPPVMTVAQVRFIIQMAGLPAIGVRAVSGRGRWARCYRSDDLIQIWETFINMSEKIGN